MINIKDLTLEELQSYFKENFTREIYMQRLQQHLENLLKEL